MNIDTLRRKIKKAYQKRHNWRDTGAEFGVTGGMVYRIAMSDYEPKRAHIRAALGLPVYIPAPACPHCGIVHISKRCPSQRKQPRDLFSMSVAELRWRLEHREEYN